MRGLDNIQQRALDAFYNALDAANLENLNDKQNTAYYEVCDLCDELQNTGDTDFAKLIAAAKLISPRLAKAALILNDNI